MHTGFSLSRTAVLAAFVFLGGDHFATAQSVNSQPDAAAIPWGISSSASASRNHAEWFPKMSEAGVSWVRLFPEWRGVEPTQGVWKWERTDAMLKSAAENKIHVEAILMGRDRRSRTRFR